MSEARSEPLRRSVRVRCSLHHAFATFTDRVDLWWPRGHRRLGASRLRFESRVGGRFFERTDDGAEAELGEVVRWEPPRRVTYTWWPGAIDAPTLVDVRFREEAGETVVEIEHSEGESGLGEAWSGRVERFRAGWAAVLPAFERYVKDGGGS